MVGCVHVLYELVVLLIYIGHGGADTGVCGMDGEESAGVC